MILAFYADEEVLAHVNSATPKEELMDHARNLLVIAYEQVNALFLL